MSIRPLTSGALSGDIMSVMNNANLHPQALTYEVILHTPTTDIVIRDLISVEISKDYANDITDYVLVSFMFAMGDYIKLVHPDMDNLEMSVNLKYYGESYPERYKLIIVNGPKSVSGNLYSSYSREELNKQDMFMIEGQCLLRIVEGLRNKTTDGVYAYSTVKNVIRSVMYNSISEVSIEGQTADVRLDFVQPNNEKVYRHISIPLGVRVLDLPTYLQNTDYGVYNTDIGTYLQKYNYFEDKEAYYCLFVYPLYNNKLTDTPGKKLLILNTPLGIMSNSEKSYFIDGDIIKIIGHSDVVGNEVSETNLIDKGSGIITTAPDSIMSPSAIVTDNAAFTTKDLNISGELVKTTKDGVDAANYTSPVSNNYKVLSNKSRDLLSSYKLTWKYSNPYLLYPGMPVSFLYDDGTHGVVKLTGILHSHFTKYSASDKTHVTLINFLLEPYVDRLGAEDVVDITY